MPFNRNNLNHIVAAAVIIAAGLLAYSNILHAPFVFDDHVYILGNPFLRDLRNFTDLSGTRYLAFFSFAINYAIGGYDPFGYHVLNVAVHIGSGIVLYLIILDIFRTPALRGRVGESVAMRAAFTAALLFTVHPVQTEAVTYLSQRFVSLAAFFYYLSVFMFIRARTSLTTSKKGGGWLFYALSLVFALAAQKTKEISFTLPAVIVLVEFTFFNTGERVLKRGARLLPFFLLFAVIPLSLFTSGAERAGDLPQVTELLRTTLLKQLATLSRHDYLLTQFRVIVTYMRLIIFPAGQNLDYDYPVYRSFFDPAVFISFFFLTGVFFSGVYLLVRGLREKRALLLPISFGIIFFFITISVASSIIPLPSVIFEYRVYLSTAGAFMLVACLYHFFVEKAFPGLKKPYAMVPVLVVAAVLAFSTHMRNRVWTSDLALWGDVVKKSPGKARGYNNLGVALFHRKRYAEAMENYRRAAELNPDNAEALSNIAEVLVILDRPEEALGYVNKALELRPGFADGHRVLGTAYAKLGRSRQAVEEFTVAIRINPDFAEAYNNLGETFLTMGRDGDAARAFEEAVRIDPSNGEFRKNLARAGRPGGLSVP